VPGRRASACALESVTLAPAWPLKPLIWTVPAASMLNRSTPPTPPQGGRETATTPEPAPKPSPVPSLSSLFAHVFRPVTCAARRPPPLSIGIVVRRATPSKGLNSRYPRTKPVSVAAMAGALTAVPETVRGSPSGPAPRRSSVHPAPRVGSLLSVPGTQRASRHTPPAAQAPAGELTASSVIRIAFALATSTSAHPAATTPQSSARATAAKAYFPRGRSPSGGATLPLRNATRLRGPTSGMPPWSEGATAAHEVSPKTATSYQAAGGARSAGTSSVNATCGVFLQPATPRAAAPDATERDAAKRTSRFMPNFMKKGSVPRRAAGARGASPSARGSGRRAGARRHGVIGWRTVFVSSEATTTVSVLVTAGFELTIRRRCSPALTGRLNIGEGPSAAPLS
jgi:hypothetical protein